MLEEAILEIDRMIFSEENYKKYFKDRKLYLEKLKSAYYNIKCLLILFFENKQYVDENCFLKEMKYFLNNNDEVNATLKKNKNLNDKFKSIIEVIDKKLTLRSLNNSTNIKEFLIIIDIFNSIVPKILEIRREDMYES